MAGYCPSSRTHRCCPHCRADRCGILFCEGGLEPPLRRYCTITSSVATCQALFTDSNMAFEAVPSGTKCGPSQVSSVWPLGWPRQSWGGVQGWGWEWDLGLQLC